MGKERCILQMKYIIPTENFFRPERCYRETCEQRCEHFET